MDWNAFSYSKFAIYIVTTFNIHSGFRVFQKLVKSNIGSLKAHDNVIVGNLERRRDESLARTSGCL
jgi:hypothetical protein